ncbi:MAG: PAS domain-containing sensor histidine kinase [Desulfobacterales bacterium]|nr:PAS domain-containing sensor histidine kinase [Desulfobacterales bacterium]
MVQSAVRQNGQAITITSKKNGMRKKIQIRPRFLIATGILLLICASGLLCIGLYSNIELHDLQNTYAGANELLYSWNRSEIATKDLFMTYNLDSSRDRWLRLNNEFNEAFKSFFQSPVTINILENDSELNIETEMLMMYWEVIWEKIMEANSPLKDFIDQNKMLPNSGNLLIEFGEKSALGLFDENLINTISALRTSVSQSHHSFTGYLNEVVSLIGIGIRKQIRQLYFYTVLLSFIILGATGFFIILFAERNKLEKNLWTSEVNYKSLFESSQDMIFTTNPEGEILDVNAACVDQLGYKSKSELLKLSFAKHLYINNIQWKIFQKKANHYGYVKDAYSIFRKNDGTEIHCLTSGTCIRDKDDNISRYDLIAKDVTIRMDALRKLRLRQRQLQTLNLIAFELNKARAHDLDNLLQIALKRIMEPLYFSSGGIFLIDRTNNNFVLKAQLNLLDEKRTTYEIKIHDKELAHALLDRKLYLQPEAMFPSFKVSFKAAGRKEQVLTSFLITAGGKANSFIGIKIPAGRTLTEEKELQLIGSFINLLGESIENTRLLQAIEYHRKDLKKLTAMLLHSSDIERKRISGELHDEIGQALTGISLSIDKLKKDLAAESEQFSGQISDIKKQIKQTYQEIRRLSYSLHPALLSDMGLGPALEYYFDKMADRSDIQVDFKIVGFDKRINSEIEMMLYRISQEAFNNTIKHAMANRFKLSIIKSYPEIIFLAEDDGKGFEPEDLVSKEFSLGILGMRERVSMLGGAFTIRGPKGKGTRIRVEIPVKENADDSE